MSASIRMEIINWAKFNPRSDVKSTSWFRLQNYWVRDAEFMHMPNEFRIAWLCILSEASERQSEVINISPYALATYCQSTATRIIDALEIFENMGLINVIEAETPRHALPKNHVTCDASDALRGSEELRDDTNGRTDGRTDEHTRRNESPAFGPDQLVDIWNEHSGPLPKVKKLSTKRRRTAKVRCREEPDPEFWRDVIKRMAASPFCRGEVKEWRADFDFLLQPDTHVKVIEGKYDARGSPGSNKGTGPPIWTSDRKGWAKRVEGNAQGLWLDPKTHEVWQDGEKLNLAWGWRMDHRLMERAGMPPAPEGQECV